jgi:site-specific DNA-methyltransferase (adenine-specific)
MNPDIQFHLGDCLPYLKAMPDDSVDLFVTDPPYDVKNRNMGASNGLAMSMQPMFDDLDASEICEGFDLAILDEMVRVCKGINMYLFCNKPQLPMYIDYFVNRLGCTFELPKWVKTNAPPTYSNKYLTDTEWCFYASSGGHTAPGSYEDASTTYIAPINYKDKKVWGHPTIKPLPFVERLVRNSSKPGDIVCDPFAGVATSAIACIENDRNWRGCEINEKWHGRGTERINNQLAQQSLF